MLAAVDALHDLLRETAEAGACCMTCCVKPLKQVRGVDVWLCV